MLTAAQLNANRANGALSNGPATSEGKTRSSRNALKFGLFTAETLVLPGEREQYEALCESFRAQLEPVGPLEETLTLEIIRAAWRLERCGKLEAALADQLLDGTLEGGFDNDAFNRRQTSIDRARAASHNIIRRSTAQLRLLQTDRQTRAALRIPERAHAGLADYSPAVRTLYTRDKTANARARSRVAEIKEMVDREIADLPARYKEPNAA